MTIDRHELVVRTGIVVGMLCFLAFIIGAGTASVEGRCRYARPIEFFPAHALGCELWRDWKRGANG